MSTFHRVRGMIWRRRSMCCVIAVVLALGIPPAVLADSVKPSAELSTYQRDDGQTFFALSLSPPSDSATGNRSHDVVILFDTSASQAGMYRETALAALEACIAKLGAEDRVQLLAVDLEARPITEKFLAAGSAELRSAIEKLRAEPPLGSTDMEHVVRETIGRFEPARPAGRCVLYIGDGLSKANLLGTESFGKLVEQLGAARISLSSYAVGPQCDGRLLAALANQTGGNLYVAEPMEWANEQEKVTEDRARQENLRRGAEVGALMADWTRATVLWPAAVKWPAELGEVYPKSLPPLRTDRDTIVVGATSKPLEKPIAVTVRVGSDVEPIDLKWTAGPQSTGDSHAFLAQLVEMARSDGGISLPTLGTAGLTETGRLLESEVDGLTELAERAIATGDVKAATVAAQAVLQRDPKNVKAQTVERLVKRRRTEARPAAELVAQIAPGEDEALADEDLNLVRTAQQPLPPQVEAEPPADEGFPAPGSLTDRFAGEGELLDEVQEQRRVLQQLLRREIENVVIDARRRMSADPDAASQDLKLAMQNVERAPELSADVRSQLLDKLQVALREAQHQAVIKDELDAEREEELAAARERRMLNDRLAREKEREQQLIDRYNALMDEGRYEEAMEVASAVEEVDPEGVTPVVAFVSSQLMRNDYLMQVSRANRWTKFFDTLHQVELSAIPFPDDPPIVYPAAPVWEELTNRRKDRYGSMDLKATGEAERRIETALRSPLKSSGLDFADTALEEVVSLIQEQYGIPVQLDMPALEEIGIDPQEPVTVNLHGISLRSALRLMLKQLELTYIVQDEVLMITTPEAAEAELVVKVYPVADLVLPIDASLLSGGLGGGIGGGGGGIGGQGGGGFGGGGQGGGGFGGGGGGFGGGGGGGGFGGGGGGFFSVPDRPDKVHAKPANVKNKTKLSAIPIDRKLSPDEFWNGYFSSRQADQAAVRETVRQLMGRRQIDQVIALIHAALRHGQPQAWMYESLGIAMELGGRSEREIERAVMSAADFSTSADELMYIAQYLSRLGLDRRAMLLYQQVAKIEPLRSEAYALGLRAAEQAEDLAGIQWATVGILSQAWPTELAEIELTASRVARATLERLASEGRNAERDGYLEDLQQAVVRDCVVQVSWTGHADIDVAVEEPAGTVCSVSEPRTTAGGVRLGDAYSPGSNASQASSEVYVCPKGFAGKYRVRINRVWGDVAAGKVTVDVYTHLRSGQLQHERQQIELNDDEAMVVFDLDRGRRTEPLAAAQLAGAVKRQEAISRAVLAQQISSGSDPRVIPGGSASDFARRAALLGGGGAVGFQPIIQVLPEGTMMSVFGVVSADRRYVRVAVSPIFSTIGDVTTFTFAGQADPAGGTGGGGTGTGGTGTGGTGTGGTGTGGAGTGAVPQLNQGGGGFGGR
jgi:tetratricopeptide (TPR) repeat protein